MPGMAFETRLMPGSGRRPAVKRKRKPIIRGYAIREPTGELLLPTISRYSSESRRLCIQWLNMTWEQQRRIGYRCVRVEVREIVE